VSPHVSVGVPVAVAALKTVTLALGGAVTWFAYRTWRPTGSRALRALAVGIGVVVLGGLLAGLVDLALPLDRGVALLVESVFSAAGFAILLYSLYVESSTPP
jgi:hypothetical protein